MIWSQNFDLFHTIFVKDFTLWNFGSWCDRSTLKALRRSDERRKSLLLQKVDEDFSGGFKRARSRVEQRMLVEEKLLLEEERWRFLVKKRKQEENKRLMNRPIKDTQKVRNNEIKV